MTIRSFLEEFTNPVLYDAENRWAADDDFYLALATEIGEPVLDIACGTGRLTRAIAATGLSTTGVDIMQPMLDSATRAGSDCAVEWIRADCRTMTLAKQFRLALMTSHGFQCLLTRADQVAMLATVHAHLQDEGVLAFETRNPQFRTGMHPADYRYSRSLQDDRGCRLDITVELRFDNATQLDYLEKTSILRETGERWCYRTILRYTGPDELHEMLTAQGFDVIQQFGYWNKTPLTPASPEIITVCRKMA